MAKKKLGFRETLQDMITTNVGSVSSKIVIGALTYLILTAAMVTIMFINPAFPGLTELVSVLIITSASLLGLTTVENIKQTKNDHGRNKDKNVYGGGY